MQPLILIPCKSFAAGKSRLSPVLSATERDALCRRFLGNTLALALSLVAKDDVRVVSADPAVARVAAAIGIDCAVDGDTGLNAALAGAISGFLASKPDSIDRDVLILPIDLALATPGAVAPVLAATADLVLVSDHSMHGTNMLRLQGAVAPRFNFQFGPDSFSMHLKEAERLRLRVEILRDANLNFDVDTPADYDAWLGRRG